MIMEVNYVKKSSSSSQECGIAQQKTTSYTPGQNEVVERMNMLLKDKARSMLNGARLGQ